jgi:CheY-like chemotaxis protein
VKKKILIIEDNEQNLYLLSYILNKHGYVIEAARNGEEGIKAAVSFSPDLILLDVQLPGMDGYAVARRLRADPDLRDIPIVAVTSYAMMGDRERAIESGCTGYIKKPIDPDIFVSQVENHLAKGISGGDRGESA